jgi:hypothetical protein
MTPLAPIASPTLAGLREAAAGAGLTVTSSAAWPGTQADDVITPLAGFIESSFSPLLAEVAGRALRARAAAPRAPGGPVTAIVMVSALGDVTTAVRTAAAVDAGQRVPPLLFFQSVPNAVAGYLAARWQLTGPVVCVTGTAAALDLAALLIDDADADDVLVVRVELAVTGVGDRAAAILVTGPDGRDQR